MVLSCGKRLVVRSENRDRTREVKVGAGDFASVAGEFKACFVRYCEAAFALDVSAQ